MSSQIQARRNHRRRHLHRGWLDTVYMFLLFELAVVIGTLGLMAAGVLRPTDIIVPGYPVGIQATQWLIWLTAPPILWLGFLLRLRGYALLFAAVSFLQTLALELPGLMWPRIELAWDWTSVLVGSFMLIDVIIALYLFFGCEPRRAFRVPFQVAGLRLRV